MKAFACPVQLCRIIVFLVIALTSNLSAQLTGHINLEQLGIAFDIPANWMGQETNQAILLGSNSEAGLIILTLHDHNDVNMLKADARNGIIDQGIQLSLNGDFEAIGDQGVGAPFTGVMQGQAVDAYISGIVNPYGQGVSVLAVTTKEQYSSRYRDLVLQISKSLQFSQVANAVVDNNDWHSLLNHTKLTYLNSYNSGTGSYGGYTTGGGYSDEESIELCPAGYFRFSSSSTMSFDSGGGFGYSGDQSAGHGKWSVKGNVLTLQFNDGSVKTYTCTMEDGKTFLNGYRYYRIGAGDQYGNGPSCF